MVYTYHTKNAMNIAYKVHEGQVDKGGFPYFHHVLWVAEQMLTEYETCVALLHDVLEDTDNFKAEAIEAYLQKVMPKEVYEAVLAITRKDEGETYMDYIRRLGENKLARAVKLKDLEHNTNIDRLLALHDDNYLTLLSRYSKAAEYLRERAHEDEV